jgi:hypothetical protein
MYRREIKMNFKTGRKLPDGTEIMLGDKLKGDSTYEVVVLWDKTCKEYGIEIIDIPEFWFELDEFLSMWGNLYKIGSIIERNKSK